jgi:NADP-dependent 3-hydroxy acid dehydrogenase YdfG
MAKALEGTVALVTGASSGIGESTTLALAAEGAVVVAAARRRERLEAVAEQAPVDSRVVPVQVDVTEETQVRSMVDTAVRDLGRLDVLVNNAGVMLLGNIEGAPTEEWRRMVNLNLLGLFYCTHAALPHLLSAAQGPRGVADVVNVSSVAGRVARLHNGVYAATKFGVVAFSESLRQEVTERHVRVTVVEPGATMTELATHNRPEVLEKMAKNFTGIELMKSEDIAAAVRYAVTQPRNVAVNELLIRPTEQLR